jgi:hypothetical protein
LEECNPELVNSYIKTLIVKIILDTKVTMLVMVVRFERPFAVVPPTSCWYRYHEALGDVETYPHSNFAGVNTGPSVFSFLVVQCST